MLSFAADWRAKGIKKKRVGEGRDAEHTLVCGKVHFWVHWVELLWDSSLCLLLSLGQITQNHVGIFVPKKKYIYILFAVFCKSICSIYFCKQKISATSGLPVSVQESLAHKKSDRPQRCNCFLRDWTTFTWNRHVLVKGPLCCGEPRILHLLKGAGCDLHSPEL